MRDDEDEIYITGHGRLSRVKWETEMRGFHLFKTPLWFWEVYVV